MNFEVLEVKTKKALEKIGKEKVFAGFYMAGGTALALQLKHRQSIDLDWFSQKPLETRKIIEALSKLGALDVRYESEDTLHMVLDEVKISVFYYPYNLIESFIQYSESVALAGEMDIACMKLQAISSRGSKKDFIDLFFLLKKHKLGEILDAFDKKYSKVKYNHLHLLKSLVFFENAESEPMPIMLVDASWEEVKNNIVAAVQDLQI